MRLVLKVIGSLQKSLRIAKVFDLNDWFLIDQDSAQPGKRICPQLTPRARFLHLGRVLDEMHARVNAFEHQVTAAGLFIFAVHQNSTFVEVVDTATDTLIRSIPVDSTNSRDALATPDNRFVYIANFGSFNRTYGTILAFIFLLVWLYWSDLLLLVGEQINLLLERQEGHEEEPKSVSPRGGTKAQP